MMRTPEANKEVGEDQLPSIQVDTAQTHKAATSSRCRPMCILTVLSSRLLPTQPGAKVKQFKVLFASKSPVQNTRLGI